MPVTIERGPRICVDGALDGPCDPSNPDVWWEAVKPEVETALRAYLADPRGAASPSTQPLGTVVIVMPGLEGVIGRYRGDLVGDLMSEVEQAALVLAWHARGDHRRCWPGDPCRSKAGAKP